MAHTPASDSRDVATTKCDSFAKLPAELRNPVYGYYFADIEKAQRFLSSRQTRKTPWSARFLSNTKTCIKDLEACLPLLRANREIRAEAGPMLYHKYLANAEFLFIVNYHNGAETFRRLQAICASFATFDTKTKPIKFGIQISTDTQDTSLLLHLADCIHQYVAWRLQRKGLLQHELKLIDGRIDDDQLAKLGLSAEEIAFFAYNLEKMPRLAKPNGKDAENRLTIPGVKIQYAERTFQVFGPLATIDWEYFDFENVPWQLPSTSYNDDFVHEVHDDGGGTMFDSDGEPDETSFYDTLELEIDEDGDRTEDGLYDEYEDLDTLDDGDEVDYEGSDYFDDVTIM